MAKLLRAPTEGYAEAIVVPPILDENFELKHRTFPSNTIANPKGELKSITTRSGFVLDGPSVPIPPPFINSEEDERGEETLTDPELVEYTVKVPPPLILKALLSNMEKLLELANTPLNENCSAVILKKLLEKLRDRGKFLIMCGFSELKCKGRPFLRTARALIDVHGEEMILCDGDERLTLNMRHDTSSYSRKPHKESINMIDIYNDSYEDYLEDLFAKNHLSGNPAFSSHTDLTSPEVDECNLVDPNNDLVDTILEMFIDEHTLHYSSPPLYDNVDDDLVKLESDNDDVYDDPFDFKEDKIKESKLLIDELDPPRSSDFLPSLEYESVLFEDFSEVDVLPSTNNEDKVFNLGLPGF
nr:reverse transcriptase domain-containing protein [Tanacetum cinerariifolium]